MAVERNLPLLLKMVSPSSGCLASIAPSSEIGRSLPPGFGSSVILAGGDACRHDLSLNDDREHRSLLKKGRKARIEPFDQSAVLAVKPNNIRIVRRRGRLRKHIRLSLRDAFTDRMLGKNALDQSDFAHRRLWRHCTGALADGQGE